MYPREGPERAVSHPTTSAAIEAQTANLAAKPFIFILLFLHFAVSTLFR
jgi:hypothetical protein